MYRYLNLGTLPFPSPFRLRQSLEYNTALYYRTAPHLARSTVQLICDMLRSDEQLTASEIACTAKCSRKAVYPATKLG
jgi:hypothetical protein